MAALRAWPRRDRVEAGGEPLQERKKPQLAEDNEPGFRQDVIHALWRRGDSGGHSRAARRQ